MSVFKQKLADINKLLDEYENKIGLPVNVPPGDENELQEYLSMDRQTVEAMSPDRAIAISVRLSQYSFYLQRCLNRDKAIKTWADSELNSIIATHFNDYDKYTKYEMRASLICKENSAAKELQSIMIYASQRIERLNDLSGGIKNLSYVISLVFKNKIGDSNERRS